MAHSHPNRCEMDVARSLIHLAHVPDGNENRNQDLDASAGVDTQLQPLSQDSILKAAQSEPQHSVIKTEPTDGQHGEPIHHAYNISYLRSPAQHITPNSTPVQCPPQTGAHAHAPVLASPMAGGGEALQGHLIRQQLLAGIPPEDIITIDRHYQDNPNTNINTPENPSLIHISNQGVFFPHVPPATYTPQTAYPVLNVNRMKGEAPPSRYLTVPTETHFNHKATFERAPATFVTNAAGNTLGAYGDLEDHHIETTSFSLSMGSYAQGEYMPLEYTQPASALNLNKAEYLFGSHSAIKNEPIAVTPRHILRSQETNASDPQFVGTAYVPHGFPSSQYEGHSGLRLNRMQKPSTRDPRRGYGTMYEYDRATFGSYQSTGQAYTASESDTGQRKADTPKCPSTDVQNIQTVIEGESYGVNLNTFNILLALFKHPEIAVRLTGELCVQDLINLQSTSRACHSFTVKYLPKIVRLQTLRRSRVASHIFPWRCYSKLRFRRIAIGNEIDPFSTTCSVDSVVASTASLRWLQMVRSRDQTVHIILACLQRAGYGFPLRYRFAIFKLWFLMDIPDTARRVWTVQNRNLWTDLDLFMAIFFIVRLDMYVKIMRKNQTGGQRRLIMAQPSLYLCRDMLLGRALRSDIELLRALIRWRYNPRPSEVPEGEIFGVPSAEVGSLQYEGYGKGREQNKKLRRPDEVILQEAQRRRLDVQQMYVRIFIHGQPQTFAQCERPLVPWDLEVRNATQDCDDPIGPFLVLD
ncbi:hypothetical protein AN8189.2 [Aspergillus nidulans FGSC A4]|uniref:Uncharacterized protein n=1 Tax=Emericella nidulans (strain FGSC A4 / ATCC 38163 / CBS 112.46 / NRRL 194 / M139) TaxID=227321 RepID=Q5AU41_EMENI|nr:hypothetical protein [Aspergillus nidulans FGSC A4]EAA59211.1 hypothetical protein AN8189.2 [Aspergillus nidulans FGSC A4]CBF74069.1 TPA: conserved hypothetical protein [Aspergillus nidulans FGSC A4]|eukprot:XP_681458.1 hypothetical protein AN8189.2 [Aspergillus nidulans FGSC A4]